MKKFFVIPILSLLFFAIKVEAIVEAPIDITTMGIVELQDALKKGYITSEQLVNIYLERIQEYDGMFNSINQLNPNALSEAQKMDEERKSGNVRGVLHGIPILVKSNIDVLGIPTTGGTKSLLDNYPKNNSQVVQNLINEGAIILGSTNMSELAFSAQTSYSSYGHVKNVFNNEYTPYGSSGGSAVAITAGFAAASLGTDTNSSVRLPAAGAGLVGLRPTFGLVSTNGVIPYDVERDTVGILSKNVDDNAIVLNAITGSENYKIDDIDIKDIVIGIPTQFLVGNENSTGIVGATDEDIKNLAQEMINKLESAGAKIVYLDRFAQYNYYKIAYSTYAGITMCDNFNEYIKGTEGKIKDFNDLVNSKGHIQRLTGYAEGCGGKYKAKSVRDNLKNKYKEYVDSYYKDYDLDVIVYPTLKNKVYKINDGDNNSPGSVIASVIGYSAISLPIGFLEDGFSYSIEILIQPNKESELLNIANKFEELSENKNNLSLLTPSIYEIPINVTKLVSIYDSIYDKKEYTNLVVEIRDFFLQYNEVEDKDVKATELIDKYNDYVKDEPKELKNYIYIILGLLGLWIIKVFFKIVKKIKRRRKRRRNKKRR